MFASVEGILSGKGNRPFGSYGWGDGEWMRRWQERCASAGAKVFGEEGLIINETPDDAGISMCRKLGNSFAVS
jgi:flavorubredoxin